MDKIKNYKIEKEVHLLMAYRDKCYTFEKILAGYKMPMLVKIAAKLHDMNFKSNTYPENDLEDMLTDVLSERKRRLNADFKWTEENKAQFLLINDKLFESCEKGWKEAFEIAEGLKKRIKRRDSFLKDYQIEIRINIYPKISGDVDETVTAYLGEETLRYMEHGIGHSYYNKHFNDKDLKKSITIDKSINWNLEYFNGEFDNDYICYAIHYMLDALVWSFPDILSIEGIWVDVEVTHQYYARIPTRKITKEAEG